MAIPNFEGNAGHLDRRVAMTITMNMTTILYRYSDRLVNLTLVADFSE
jgi:hypothetical protein